MNESEYVKTRLDDQIAWYDRKSQWNQSVFRRLQMVQIVAAALIPFLAGFTAVDGGWARWTVGLLGVLVAASAGIQGLYRFQEQWIDYRGTCESLRHERYLFLTRVAPYDGEDAFRLLVKRVEARISRENAEWSQLMTEKQDQPGGADAAAPQGVPPTPPPTEAADQAG